MAKKLTLLVRLERNYTPEPMSGCWLWTASLRGGQNGDYGQITILAKKKRSTFYAHRISYELFRGAIPDGMHLDHKCRTRSCVNPHHLEAVEPVENTRRAIGLGRPRNKFSKITL